MLRHRVLVVCIPQMYRPFSENAMQHQPRTARFSYQLSVISYQKAERAMDGIRYLIDACTAGELFLGVVYLLQILPLRASVSLFQFVANVLCAVNRSLRSSESTRCSAVSKRVHELLAIASATAFLRDSVLRPRCSHATRSVLLR